LAGLAVLDVQESHTVRAACTFFVSNVAEKETARVKRYNCLWFEHLKFLYSIPPKSHQKAMKCPWKERTNEWTSGRTDGQTSERKSKETSKQLYLFFFTFFYVNKYIRKCNFLYMKNVREIAQACGKVESYIYVLNSIVVKIKTQNIHQQLKWQTTTFFPVHVHYCLWQPRSSEEYLVRVWSLPC